MSTFEIKRKKEKSSKFFEILTYNYNFIFDKYNPIWENWINKQNSYSLGNYLNFIFEIIGLEFFSLTFFVTLTLSSSPSS